MAEIVLKAIIPDNTDWDAFTLHCKPLTGFHDPNYSIFLVTFGLDREPLPV